ncbi:M56 family metallopeptidase [Fimbriimonas ginsengisoli]|uniref:TonB family protein n=1 Tax=Fimbriimonas ginsengisoli Gsoil 348 TaxID=661478 RepID=A0A068NR57_FIMGI|nr:M56 family metallopeptidase [Fimbriimonas ginsengisoli]AIE85872.1 TonB family protein [Fimbriimonas ginsengisoli Gsoil 348]
MIGDQLIQAALQGTVGVIAVGAVTRLIPSLRPNVRCWLWRLAAVKFGLGLIGAVAIPILSPEPLSLPADTAPISMQSSPGPLTIAPHVAHATSTPDTGGVLLSIWLIGAAMALVRLVFQVVWAKRLLAAVNQETQVIRGIRVSRHRSVSTPMLVGWVSPTILLPTTMNYDHAEAALAHEIAHARRYDAVWAVIMSFLGAAFWWMPTFWIARWKAQEEAELACDEFAIRDTSCSPDTYAEMLLRYSGNRHRAVSQALSGPARSLKRRILAMQTLDRRTPRYALALVLPVVLALVPWTAVARPTKPPEAGSQPSIVTQWSQYLLGESWVQSELKVTDEERGRLATINEDFMRRIRDLGNKLADMTKRQVSNRDRYAYDVPVRTKIFTDLRDGSLALLTDEQRGRLRQLATQYIGEHALTSPPVAAEAKLSPDTSAEIKHLSEKYQAQIKELKASLFVMASSHDERKLTPTERKRYNLLKKQLLEASGSHRQRLFTEYWRLEMKTVPRARPRTQEDVDRVRLQGLQVKAAWNEAIRKVLKPDERSRWEAMLGKRIPMKRLPYSWE